jgi:NDP-sugar pyrophosphorylase family protein
MKAVILAGGLGTRLRPLTYSIPKPLLPVGEKPILEMIITRLSHFGFSEFILAVGYRHELIETYFQDGKRWGVRIDYVQETTRLGTAGPLSLIREQFEFGADETFLMMNGDILTKLNLSDMLRYHRQGGYEMTVATRPHRYQLPFGALEAQEGKVQGIIEKPIMSYNISTGIYLMQSSLLPNVPKDSFFDVPDLINLLLSENRPVGAFSFEDYWLAVEQLHHIEEAQHDLAQWSEP